MISQAALENKTVADDLISLDLTPCMPVRRPTRDNAFYCSLISGIPEVNAIP